MKRTSKWSLFLLSALSVFSCGEQRKAADLFIYDDTDPFIASLQKSLKASLLEKGIEIEVHNAQRKQSLQNSQVVKALENNKGRPLLVNIVDRLSASVLIEKAQNEDTPLLFLNREPLKKDTEGNEWAKENIYFVGSNPAYEGAAQSEIAYSYFGPAKDFKGSKFDKNGDGKIQVALFRGELSHQDAEARTKYALDGLRSFGYEIELSEVAYCDWEKSKGYDEMKKIALQGGNVELLLSNNDAMALGAIDYLKENQDDSLPFLDQYFPILGVDATKEGREAVEQGYLLGTVLNDGETQAEVLASLYQTLTQGTPFPTLKENVEQDGNFYKVKGEKIVKK